MSAVQGLGETGWKINTRWPVHIFCFSPPLLKYLKLEQTQESVWQLVYVTGKTITLMGFRVSLGLSLGIGVSCLGERILSYYLGWAWTHYVSQASFELSLPSAGGITSICLPHLALQKDLSCTSSVFLHHGPFYNLLTHHIFLLIWCLPQNHIVLCFPDVMKDLNACISIAGRYCFKFAIVHTPYKSS